MASTRNLSLLLVLLLAGLLAAGLYRLFGLRFSAGDIYPAYSTYRADPLGAKIIFQSLEELPGISVERQLRQPDRLDGPGTVLLYLGGDSRSLLRQIDEELSPFLISGGRAVLAFRAADPVRKKKKLQDDAHDRWNKEQDAADSGEVDETPEAGEKTDLKKHDPKTCPVCLHEKRAKYWGVELAWFARDELEKEDPVEQAFPETDGPDGPLPWHSALYFDQLGDEWQVLYRYLGQPVIISRNWGSGSVVLLADSYLFSNEAMVVDRHPALLACWIGDSSRILFDEVHLGVSSREGVMMLLNRYRLRGVLAAFLLLAGLFVWKNSSSLIPKYSDPAGDGKPLGTGVGSAQGFTQLMRRHLPQKQLMDVMAAEWKETFCKQASMRRKCEKMDAALRESAGLPAVERYNRLTKILNERN